jgi:hypothetical protein
MNGSAALAAGENIIVFDLDRLFRDQRTPQPAADTAMCTRKPRESC